MNQKWGVAQPGLRLDIPAGHCRLRFAQAVSCIGSGQPGLSHRFCDETSIGHGLAPKIVWGTEVPGAGMPGRVPALTQMGDWCGVFLLPMPKTLT